MVVLKGLPRQASHTCLIIIDIFHIRQGGGMTKADTVAKRAEERKVRKTVAARVLSVVIDSIVQAIKRGKKLMLTGFGTLFATERKARKGRNQKTGKEIKIAAKKAPKLKAGSALKAAASEGTPATKSKKAPAKRARKTKKK
jgi:DNA-binding protein HU-beta